MSITFTEVSFTYQTLTRRQRARLVAESALHNENKYVIHGNGTGNKSRSKHDQAYDTHMEQTGNSSGEMNPDEKNTTNQQATARNAMPAVSSVPSEPANLGIPSAQTPPPHSASAQQWGETPHTPWALQNVSFSIEKGTFIGLAGHTGSGKSTLLQHMNGLITPTCGTVSVDGFSTHNKKHKKEIIKRVGLIFQYPERQLFAPTVAEDIAFGPRNLGLTPHEVNKRVAWALEHVHLNPSEYMHKSPFELSGGIQRRVAIAGVLAMQPHYVIADEPAAGLDPAAKRTLLELFKNLNSEGVSIIMASHNMNDLAQYCSRVLVLNKGQQLCFDTPEVVFSPENEHTLRSVGLEIPDLYACAARLRKQGIPLTYPTAHTTHELAEQLAYILNHKAAQYE